MCVRNVYTYGRLVTVLARVIRGDKGLCTRKKHISCKRPLAYGRHFDTRIFTQMNPAFAAVPTTEAFVEEMNATNHLEDAPSTPPALALIDEEALLSSPEPKYEEPLYTEINIPLPVIPKPKVDTGKRQKSHSISTFKPFHHRGSSSDSTRKSGEEWPRIKKELKSREVAAAMNLAGKHRRSATIDALAVVPAVLVLSAELFTPGERQKRKGCGKWEDGMI
ncbi:hypothetical protein BU23DRAFT_599463 [Bimuria novae-zelandiae CBS 107.79]|uniref:Uncharacterized protein n=1 Tax=Bimuria novae-zelandiae CBS 107.79 TaxID=1447943 RepID=A0A6A5V6J6_9PLEO|nr:hypothetical protein BU23DRAFT_599463 [Bimuria novae-zelandiae CBS 107.79]